MDTLFMLLKIALSKLTKNPIPKLIIHLQFINGITQRPLRLKTKGVTSAIRAKDVIGRNQRLQKLLPLLFRQTIL
ncbi:hypothetical protein N9C66_05085 [Akkermansiaceae bacterium]|nr:hypothetical protein [Akkermansiaceae bacterium]